MSPAQARVTTTASPPAFQHDLNACVGCHACAIACINEHALPPGRFWRQIVTFNPERRAHLPTYHLSIACNHCLDAPCEKACPSNAIARDARTGAVLIDEDACIGCRYCSWACPYDAPKFDEDAGVMRKCTLCTHRLAEGRQPACVSQCPTGALRLTPYEADARHGVAGFPSGPARPAITFVPLWRTPRSDSSPGVAQDVAVADTAAIGSDTGSLPSKISLRDEWPLAAFTFLATVMVAWQGAAMLGGPAVRPVLLLAMALTAMAVSTAHLGRPGRAWRAALNWRRSWLSREVVAFPVFVIAALAASSVAGFAHVRLPPASAAASPPAFLLANGTALVAGLALLACIDRVYGSMATRTLGRDRTAAFDSAAFLAGVLAAVPWLFVPAGVLRLGAAVMRPFRTTKNGRPPRLVRTAVRVAVGVCAPCALWLGGGSLVWAAALAILGEALDRADFYDGLSIVTPAAEMRDALAHTLANG